MPSPRLAFRKRSKKSGGSEEAARQALKNELLLLGQVQAERNDLAADDAADGPVEETFVEAALNEAQRGVDLLVARAPEGREVVPPSPSAELIAVAKERAENDAESSAVSGPGELPAGAETLVEDETRNSVDSPVAGVADDGGENGAEMEVVSCPSVETEAMMFDAEEALSPRSRKKVAFQPVEEEPAYPIDDDEAKEDAASKETKADADRIEVALQPSSAMAVAGTSDRQKRRKAPRSTSLVVTSSAAKSTSLLDDDTSVISGVSTTIGLLGAAAKHNLERKMADLEVERRIRKEKRLQKKEQLLVKAEKRRKEKRKRREKLLANAEARREERLRSKEEAMLAKRAARASKAKAEAVRELEAAIARVEAAKEIEDDCVSVLSRRSARGAFSKKSRRSTASFGKVSFLQKKKAPTSSARRRNGRTRKGIQEGDEARDDDGETSRAPDDMAMLRATVARLQEQLSLAALADAVEGAADAVNELTDPERDAPPGLAGCAPWMQWLSGDAEGRSFCSPSHWSEAGEDSLYEQKQYECFTDNIQ